MLMHTAAHSTGGAEQPTKPCCKVSQAGTTTRGQIITSTPEFSGRTKYRYPKDKTKKKQIWVLCDRRKREAGKKKKRRKKKKRKKKRRRRKEKEKVAFNKPVGELVVSGFVTATCRPCSQWLSVLLMLFPQPLDTPRLSRLPCGLPSPSASCKLHEKIDVARYRRFNGQWQ